MSHPIGIDLGTTFSAIAKWKKTPRFTGSECYTIPAENSPHLPSKVYIDELDGAIDFIVGAQAQKSGVMYPDQLIVNVKRKMGSGAYRYAVNHPDSGKIGEFTPIEISAEIIKSLLDVVDRIEGPGSYLPRGIVVTAPYYFKHHQNANTRRAALKAISEMYDGRGAPDGGESLFLGLLAEPIAAGLDYAFNREARNVEENILVFDLGGGTFDVTVFSLNQRGKMLEFEVLAVDGNDRLGGEDFDQSFFQWMCEAENIDLEQFDEKTRRRALKKIHPAITEAKIALSAARKTDLIIPQAIGAANIEIDPVTRETFERCITGAAGDERDYYGEIRDKVDVVLEKARLSPDQITWVLLAGGSSQIPKFKHALLAEKFGENKLRDAADTRLAVARGAAIYAAYKLDEMAAKAGKPREHLSLWDDIVIKERTAHQLGIDINHRFHRVLNDNLLTPCSRTEIYEPTTLSEDGQRAILKKISVVQGDKRSFVPVGEIALDDVFTHGRDLSDIDIKITFTATTNLIQVKTFVRRGEADGADYVREAELALQEEN